MNLPILMRPASFLAWPVVALGLAAAHSGFAAETPPGTGAASPSPVGPAAPQDNGAHAACVAEWAALNARLGELESQKRELQQQYNAKLNEQPRDQAGMGAIMTQMQLLDDRIAQVNAKMLSISANCRA